MAERKRDGGLSRYIRQFLSLLKKNSLVKWRNKKVTFFEIMIPVVIMILMVVIRGAIDKKSVPEDLNGDFSTDIYDKAIACGNFSQNFLSRMHTFNHKVAISPDTAFTRGFATYLDNKCSSENPSLNFSGDIAVFYDSASDINSYVSSSSYAAKGRPSLWMAINVLKDGTADGDNKFNIRFRGNQTGARDFHNPPLMVPENYDEAVDKLAISQNFETFSTLLEGGIPFMQAIMNEYIIETTTGRTPEMRLRLSHFPNPEYTQDDFADVVKDILGLFFALTYMWPVAQMVSILVQEKELKIKEAMKIMGLHESTLWTSWFVTYAIIFLITAILITIFTSGSVFEHSDKSLILLFFWMYSLTIFSFTYMMSSLFSRAKTASSVTAVLFLGIFFPYFALGDRASTGERATACLSSPICFGQGATTIAELESEGLGLTYDTSTVKVDNFAISTAYSMFFFDTILYLLLGLYFERVFPSDIGLKRHWLFPITDMIAFFKRLGGKKKGTEDVELIRVASMQENPNFEEVRDPDMKVGMAVSHLHKEFPSEQGPNFIAVENFTANLYEGQIFALLGHNGAGKTTTINMLSGMIPFTSGEAHVYGHSIEDEMDIIRDNLGYCPQHDILFKDLTVREHLVLFGTIKGVPSASLDDEITKIIAEVGLTEKVDARSTELSGGMKRKLSVAIALIGGSKVVFLDEPTSGMDPYSRRSTWALLQEAKKDRVIILTTHFMDEADELGDRIAIMARGNIKCLGSSLFLKGRYGVGYTLTVNKTRDADADTIIDTVTKHVSDAEVLSSIAGEVSFRLAFEASSKFPELLADLDQGEKHGIDTYNVSVTTLEEVFLRVGNQDAADVDEKRRLNESLHSIREARSHSNLDLPGAVNAGPHDVDLKVDKMNDLPESKEAPATDNEFEKEISKVKSGQRVTGRRFHAGPGMFMKHFLAMIWKRFHHSKRDRKTIMWQVVYPFLVMLAGVGLLELNFESTPIVNLSPSLYDSPSRIPYNNITGSDQFSPVIHLQQGNTVLGGNGVVMPLVETTNRSVFARELLENGFGPSLYGDYEFKQSKYGAFMIVEENATAAKLDAHVLFNGTATLSSLVYPNVYVNAFMREANSDPNAEIKYSVQAFPLTADQQTLRNSLTAVMMSIAFAFVPASIVAYVVKEREVKAKHQQLISGVDITAYWISMYAWDFLFFMITALLAVMVVGIFDLSELLGEAFLPFFLGLILFALSVISFTYMMSFLFESHTSAQNVMLITYILTGAVLLIVSIILSIIESTREVNEDLLFVYRLFPNFAFGSLLASLIVRDAELVFGEAKDPWDLEVSGYNLLYLAITAVAYFLIVLFIEKYQRTPSWQRLFRKKRTYEAIREADLDEDITAERQRVKEGKADDDVLKIDGIGKIFTSEVTGKDKVAVRELYLGVPAGEIFGLLGINGAGKTTAMRMLTADEVPSYGNAFVNSLSVMTHQQEIRKLLGYCPQFDALIETLTARETLTLFTRIKGLPEDEIPTYVAALGDQLGLSEYMDKPCGGYSGGNKRKLSVGIALIGNPPVVFLDEPSTGMDPKARRSMWNLISSTMIGRCVILTTHSMEECEALCSRIGIMVGGRMRCLGTSSHLKQRYGSGYQMNANTGERPASVMVDFVKDHFKDFKVLEQHSHSIKINVPSEIMPLGEIFALIEKHKDELGLREYSVSETSLEQIFIRFARQQEEETGAVAGLDVAARPDSPAPAALADNVPASSTNAIV